MGQKHRSGKKKKKKEKKACDNNGPQSPAAECAQLPRPTTSPPMYHVNTKAGNKNLVFKVFKENLPFVFFHTKIQSKQTNLNNTLQ